jgi:hypothetical protein
LLDGDLNQQGKIMGIETEFTQALEGTVEAAKGRGYIPTYFMKMLAEHGGVETAKRLLAKSNPQAGLYELWRLDLLHESMEATVLQEKFHFLFTEEELAEAHQRLEKLKYFDKDI